VALAVVVVLLAGLAVVGWLALPGYARRQAVERARQHGVVLELGSVELGWSEIAIVDFRFTLVGAPGISGKVGRMVVSLDGFEPTRFDVRGVELAIEGSATSLALAFGEWSKNYPRLYRYPVEVDRVDLLWRSERAADPWLRITGATIAPLGGGARFVAERAEVLGIDVGRVGASWRGDDTEVSIGFGTAALDAAPVKMTVRHALKQPEVDIVLKRTALQKLAGPLGVALPIQGVSASASARLRFAEGPTRGAVDGKLEASFEGYAPPVPPQLRGFVFGTKTAVSTVVEVSADRRTTILRETKLKHGAMELDGEGTIVREDDHARISMRLEGQLSCKALTDAAARTQLGNELGGILGKFAARLVRGSVALELGIDADTRDLAAAKLSKKVGIGCGLEAIPIALPQLPPALRDKLPSGLPKLPEIPTLPANPERRPRRDRAKD